MSPHPKAQQRAHAAHAAALRGCISKAGRRNPVGLANHRTYVQRVAFADGHVLGQMSTPSGMRTLGLQKACVDSLSTPGSPSKGVGACIAVVPVEVFIGQPSAIPGFRKFERAASEQPTSLPSCAHTRLKPLWNSRPSFTVCEGLEGSASASLPRGWATTTTQ